MKILLVSGTGLLGTHLARHFRREEIDFVATAREGAAALDLARPVAPQLRELLADGAFTHAVLCAAIADPAACPRDPSLSSRVNVEAVGELAAELASRNIRVAYFSTDLVFSGDLDLCRENEPVSPVTLYGRQKAAAEDIVRATSGNLIFRTSKLMAMDLHPRSILTPIVRAGRGEAEYRAFIDQFITPIFCEDVGRFVVAAIRGSLSGTYHLAGADRLSRVELAHRTCAALGLDAERILGIRMEDARLAEPRGRFNTLCADRIRLATGISPTPLAEGLARLRASL